MQDKLKEIQVLVRYTDLESFAKQMAGKKRRPKQKVPLVSLSFKYIPSWTLDKLYGNNMEQENFSLESDLHLIVANSQTVSHNRILVVDDDPDIATLFKITLERDGIAVDVFNDPLIALSSYKAGIYDLLLLDIRMLGMNGLELCQKIKNVDDKVKACFVTAYDEEYQKDLVVNQNSKIKIG